jgi:hypothetical protein
MHNVALAVLNYESAKKKFPVGFVSQPSGNEAWGWSVFILPYLEEQALYDKLSPSETFQQPVDGTRKNKRNLADALKSAQTDASDLAAVQTPIAVFRCASDTTPDLVPCEWPGGGCTATAPPAAGRTAGDFWERSFRGTYAPGTFLPPASNYMGNRGMIDAGCPAAAGSTAANWVPNQSICDSNGIFFGNSHIKIGQITDGTGKTFMIGERDAFCLAGTWLGARNPADGSEIHSSLWTLGHVAGKNSVPNYPITAAYDTCPEGFSSAHAGGVFFAFCDGSVHFISDDIQNSTMGNSVACTVKGATACQSTFGALSIGVYQRLGWRDDGVPIDDSTL